MNVAEEAPMRALIRLATMAGILTFLVYPGAAQRGGAHSNSGRFQCGRRR